jgi:hypothetical protein
LRSPALISTSSKAGCHAVLASLSGRYPPLEGRSPTCYSPVCHSTHPLRDFRVRLACVRHAASVDSEPGSNSHVKFAGCFHPKVKTTQLVNARPIYWLCVVQSVRVLSGSSPVAFARTDNSGRPIPRRHLLTLIVPTPPACASFVGTGCVCLHALSSFQRTDRSVRPWRPEFPSSA